MMGPQDIYLFLVACRLEQYLGADADDAEELIQSLPKDFVEDLQVRLLQILRGDDPREVLEFPWRKGGRPTTAVRDFCIALEFLILREEKNEKYEVALKLLQERWELKQTAVKNAIQKYADEGMKFLVQIRAQISNVELYVSVAKKFSKIPPLV